MNDKSRVLLTRFALLAGILWFGVRLAMHRSLDSDVVLGFYSESYFRLLVVALIASLAGIASALWPGLRRVVLADRFRVKMAVFAAWLPAWLAIYASVNARMPVAHKSGWDAAFAGLLIALTAAMLFATLDAWRVAVRKPEFWLAVGSVVVTLLLLEGAMRYWIRHIEDDPAAQQLYDPAFSNPNNLRYVPHHYSGYIPNPEWSTGNGLDRHNSLGFRGEEVAVPKPEGIFRIVTLGGSTTYGTTVPSWSDAYPAQLQDVLRDEYGYGNVEVINGGVGGYNSWETLVNFEFRALDLEPDLIIVYQNTNDVQARLVDPEAYRGDNSARRLIWDLRIVERAEASSARFPSVLWRYVAYNLGWLDNGVTKLNNIGTQPCTGADAGSECFNGLTPAEVLQANPPIYYERNIRSIVAIAQANGVDVLLLTWAYVPQGNWYGTRPEIQAAFDEQNLIMARLAGEMDTYFYDFAAEMPREPGLFSDGRHMTVEGNRVRAELIAAFLDGENAIPQPQ